MREMFRLFIVVAIFSAVAGLALAAVQTWTAEKIETQELKYVKGPTLIRIFEGCSNDPLNDRFKLIDNEKEINFFVGAFDGNRNSVAFETAGKGFGGDIGVLVAVNLETEEIVGIGVTTHGETPGLGSRTKDDPAFSAQFKGTSINDPFNVKADGGSVDAVTGATISSRGVCSAITEASEMFSRLKDDIKQNLNG
ncbi:MAG: RnfABCDGE type electron transport complex subunit G [Deltaproteobacteria bacterium]|nr:RnfABCDGE type electron transport complex subunit G [Deltaproteobacteria bacterium]MBW1914082.1 RnfABCDGE type electron transport complex subunit G [Deltaproteobacteria bacterium]